MKRQHSQTKEKQAESLYSDVVYILHEHYCVKDLEKPCTEVLGSGYCYVFNYFHGLNTIRQCEVECQQERERNELWHAIKVLVQIRESGIATRRPEGVFKPSNSFTLVFIDLFLLICLQLLTSFDGPIYSLGPVKATALLSVSL